MEEKKRIQKFIVALVTASLFSQSLTPVYAMEKYLREEEVSSSQETDTEQVGAEDEEMESKSEDSEIVTAQVASTVESEGFVFSEDENGALILQSYKGASIDVVVPDSVDGKSVISIGDSAFQNNLMLRSVKLGDSCKSIGRFSFGGCAGLEEIDFGQNLEEIKDQAFTNCTSLTKVNLPDSVVSIGSGAFQGCTALNEFRYPLNWTKVEGANTGSHNWFMGSIFRDCSNLKSVTVPEGVSVIPQYAFEGSSISEFKLPSTLEKIEKWSFSANESLPAITLPDSLREICQGAFANDSNLNSVKFGSGLEIVADRVFENCTSLVTVKMPDSVVSIGSGAFQGCTALNEFRYPLNWTKVEGANTGSYNWFMGSIFRDCSNLKSVTVPEGVSVIPQYAFEGSSISEFKLPSTLEKIEKWSFSANESLPAITLPDSLREICQGAFANDSNLNSVKFGSGLEIVADRVFENCTSLVTVKMPDSVVSIGSGAFQGCTALDEFRYPLNWTQVGEANTGSYNWFMGSIFKGCSNFKSVTIPEGVLVIPPYAFEGSSISEFKLPSTLEKIEKWSFSANESLTAITLPDSLREICQGAFAKDSNLNSVKFGSGLEIVADRVFENCTSLETAELPDSVISIGSGAFQGCTALNEFRYPLNWAKVEGANTGSHNWFMGSIFRDCSNLKSVTVPEGVSVIPQYAFEGSSISEFKLPSTLEKIEKWSFSANESLPAITLPDSLREICQGAFANDSNLNSVKFGSGLEIVADRVFENCTSLVTVKIPDSVVSIGSGAFQGCTALNEFRYPLNWTKVEGANTGSHNWFMGSIFKDCVNLKTIIVPEGVSVIPPYAFEQSSLEQIVMPKTLEKIGESAFRNCMALKSVTSLVGGDDVLKFGSNVFTNCPNLTVTASVNGAAAAAIDCNAKLHLVDEHNNQTSSVMDYGNTDYSANLASIPISGRLTSKVRYSIDSEKFEELSDIQLVIKQPRGYAIETVTGNDKELIIKEQNDFQIIEAPVTSAEGLIELNQIVLENVPFRSYVYLKYKDKTDGNIKSEILGVIDNQDEVFTLNAPETVSGQTLKVNGFAPAGTEVILRLNGEEKARALSNKAGNWSAEIEVGEQKNGSRLYLTGELQLPEKDPFVINRVIVYTPSTSELEDFNIIYNEHNVIKEQSLSNDKKKAPVVYFLPDTEYKFELKFSNPENIDNLYVTSTKNGEVKYLKAEYDEEEGVFRTSGFFDEKNHNYIPGAISYQYDKNYTEYVAGDNDLYDQFVENLEEIPEDRYEITQLDEQRCRIQLALKESLKDTGRELVDATFEVFDVEEDVKFSEYKGMLSDATTLVKYFIPGVDGDKYLLTLDYSDPENWMMLIKDFSDNSYVGAILDMGDKDYSVIDQFISGNTPAGDFDQFRTLHAIPGLKTINSVASLLYDYMSIENDVDDIRQAIMSNDKINTTQQQIALAKATQYQIERTMFLVMVTLLPLIVTTGPVGVASMSYAPVVFSGLIGLMAAASDSIFELRKQQMINNPNYDVNKGMFFFLRMMIDPSGFVYDSDSMERLPDVSCSAYWIPNDDTETFWLNKPDDDEYGTLWDAEEYSQSNPILTNTDGKYAWDVPEGWWRVKYEKAGYETTWSSWMTVPPIQTDVNIGMKKIYVPADKTLLEVLYQYAVLIRETSVYENLDDALKSLFNEALEAAEDVLNEEKPTQEAVDSAYQRLSEMVQTVDITTSADHLELLIAEAKAVDTTELTDEDRLELETALKAAEEILMQEQTDPLAVHQAYEQLSAVLSKIRNSMNAPERDLLLYLVELGEATDLAPYYETGKAAFLSELEKARTLLNEGGDSESYGTALRLLHSAWLSLRLSPDEAVLKELLRNKNEISKLNLELYTASFRSMVAEFDAEYESVMAKEPSVEEVQDLIRTSKEILRMSKDPASLFEAGKEDLPGTDDKKAGAGFDASQAVSDKKEETDKQSVQSQSSVAESGKYSKAPSKSVRTASNMNLAMYLVGLGTGAAAIAGWLVRKRKRSDKQ